MNLGPPTLLLSYGKSCKPQEQDHEEGKGNDSFDVVNELSLFLNFYDGHYHILAKYSCS